MKTDRQIKILRPFSTVHYIDIVFNYLNSCFYNFSKHTFNWDRIESFGKVSIMGWVFACVVGLLRKSFRFQSNISERDKFNLETKYFDFKFLSFKWI